MKKRLLSLLIAGVMTAGLLSGGGASEDTQDQSGSVAQPDQSSDETGSDAETSTEDTSDGSISDRKTLVVYYSEQEIQKQQQIVLRMLQKKIYLN